MKLYRIPNIWYPNKRDFIFDDTHWEDCDITDSDDHAVSRFKIYKLSIENTHYHDEGIIAMRTVLKYKDKKLFLLTKPVRIIEYE
jgi:hypothetical protein